MTAKTSKPKAREREADRGYTKADLEDVFDAPEFTADEIAQAKPFAETFPELAASANPCAAGRRLRRSSSSACGSIVPSSRLLSRRAPGDIAGSTRR
jgi:hypothetical protein